MSFQRVLVAVDEAPIAAHAADVAIELSTGLGAKLAFVHVVDPEAVATPDGGIPASELIARAEQDASHYFWSSRPSAWLAVALLADAVVGLTIGLFGLGELHPLSLSQMALIVAFSAACSLTVNDVIKARLIRAERTLR